MASWFSQAVRSRKAWAGSAWALQRHGSTGGQADESGRVDVLRGRGRPKHQNTKEHRRPVQTWGKRSDALLLIIEDGQYGISDDRRNGRRTYARPPAADNSLRMLAAHAIAPANPCLHYVVDIPGMGARERRGDQSPARTRHPAVSICEGWPILSPSPAGGAGYVGRPILWSAAAASNGRRPSCQDTARRAMPCPCVPKRPCPGMAPGARLPCPATSFVSAPRRAIGAATAQSWPPRREGSDRPPRRHRDQGDRKRELPVQTARR